MAVLTENEIITGCIAYDRRVQEYLYRLYYSDFIKICMRYATNMQDAEQWLNDSFYKIFTKIGQYRNEGSFEGWMKRIIIYTCLDSLKNLARNKNTLLMEVDDRIQVQYKDCDSTLEQINFKELIGMIQRLPDMHRTVFNLFVFEGFSHKEIAKVMDIKEGTSAWYINQARELLKQKVMAASKSIRYGR